jgi:hypothetical protein
MEETILRASERDFIPNPCYGRKKGSILLTEQVSKDNIMDKLINYIADNAISINIIFLTVTY